MICGAARYQRKAGFGLGNKLFSNLFAKIGTCSAILVSPFRPPDVIRPLWEHESGRERTLDVPPELAQNYGLQGSGAGLCDMLIAAPGAIYSAMAEIRDNVMNQAKDLDRLKDFQI